MKLHPSTKIHDLLETYPFLLDFLAAYRPKFSILKNRAMRATMGRMATLSMVASMGDTPLETLLKDIASEIAKNTGEEIEIETSSDGRKDRENLDELKEIIRDLHKSVELSTVKQRFDRLMNQIDPSQIASMEEELIREGMPAEGESALPVSRKAQHFWAVAGHVGNSRRDPENDQGYSKRRRKRR